MYAHVIYCTQKFAHGFGLIKLLNYSYKHKILKRRLLKKIHIELK